MKSFKILFKKSLRDFLREMKQFIAIVFILAVSVTLFSGLEANAKELERRVNEEYQNGNLADVWVTFNEYNEDEYNNILEIAEGENTSSNLEENEYINKRLYMPFLVDNTNAYASLSDEYPTINKGYDLEFSSDDTLNNDFYFLVDSGFKKRYPSLETGDTLPVSFDASLIKASLLNIANLAIDNAYPNQDTTIIKATALTYLNSIFTDDKFALDLGVTAFMSQPENIQNSTFNSSNFLISTQYLLYSSIIEIENSFEIIDVAKEVLSYSKSYLKSNDVETINTFISSICNQYCVKVDDSITVEDATNKINDYYKDNSNLYATFTREQLLSNSVISNDISQAYDLALAFPLIFCVVAILVVLTTISQLILKQRMQIGTMKALGFSKRQILFNYISFMCGVSLVGVILGLIIGPLLLPNVLNIKYNLLYALPAQQYNFPWLIAILIVVAVLLLVSLLTYLLIRKELSLTPANSMRPATPNVKLKTRKSFLKDPFIRMALRNIKVHFTKTIMIIIGVLGCTGLLICGFGIDDSINYGKDYDMKNFYGADITVNYTSNNTTLKDKILAIEGVSSVDEYSTLSSQVDNNGQTISKLIHYFSEDSVNFHYEKWDDSGVGLDSDSADELGIKEGGSISFSYGGNSYSIKVNKVFYTFSIHGLFVFEETLPTLTSTRTNAWVNLKDGADVNEVSSNIKSLSNVSNCITYSEMSDKINGYMESIQSMTLAIKVFAIILAIIVLINLGVLNFNERIRDIATLRVLGFRNRQIGKSLLYEAMFSTIIGSLLGIFLGMPMLYVVLGTNKTPLVTFYYYIKPESYIIAVLLSILTAFIVNLLLNSRVKKVSMSESLKSVE